MSEPAPLLNVLLVSGGGFQGLAVLKGLLRAGHVRVVLADCYAENIGRYFAHRSHVVPPVACGAEFLEALLRICAAEEIHVIFPSTEFELPFLAEHAAAFASRGIRLALSNAELLRRLSDKSALYAFLRQEGLPAPAEVNLASSSVTFPLLGKPKSGWGGKGQIVLKSAEELRRHALAELQQRYVWEPFLREFTEYSVDFAINFHGAISECVIRERLRVSGGFAVVARIQHEQKVAELARRFADAVLRQGGLGIFNVQILRTQESYFISDVNPRVGTSAVAYDAGVNLPLFVCSPETKPAPPAQSRPGKAITMVRYLEELYVPECGLDGIRGVVFDLDDTLLDQKRWILEKLRGLYPAFESRLPAPKEFLTRALMILEEGNRAGLIDAVGAHFGFGDGFCKELIAAYRQVSPKRAEVYPDVRPVIAELKRRGYRLGILTNNPPASQRQKIAACGFEKSFDEIIYARESGAEKPAPDGFVQIAARLKLAPGEIVMAGDNLYCDIAGALQAGYRHGFLVARSGTFYNFDVGTFEELCGQSQALTVITSLRDILRQLKAAR